MKASTNIQNLAENHPSSDDWRTRVNQMGLSDKNWLRTREAAEYSGLQVSVLYSLTPHEIKSFLLRRDPHAVRGVRLWSRASINAYFDKKFEEALAVGN